MSRPAPASRPDDPTDGAVARIAATLMVLATMIVAAPPDHATAATRARRRSAVVAVTLLERRPIDHGLISVKAIHDGGQGRAERVMAEVDCQDRAIHVLSRESLPGDRLPLDPADPLGWRPISPGEADFGIWEKTCAAGRPLVAAAQAEEAPRPPSPSAMERPITVSGGSGVYRLQVGSFKTRQLAQKALESVSSHLDIAQARLSIQTATIQGASVYRAIINDVSSQDEATRTCNALRGQGIDCMVLVHAARP